MRKIICPFISICLLFPISICEIGGYKIGPEYLVVLLSTLFFPVLVVNKRYWCSTTTRSVWFMRLTSFIVFFVAGFKYGFDISRAVSFAGYISITFLYELPFIFCMTAKDFFITQNKVFNVLLLYATFVVGFYYLKVNNFLGIINYVRGYLPMYPNYFGVLLVVHFWAKRYFIGIYDKYDILIIALIFLSLSRTAISVFIASYVINSFLLQKKEKRLKSKIIVAFILLPLFLLSAKYFFMYKEASPGATIERTLIGRIERWYASWDEAKKSLIIGSGFSRTSAGVKFYMGRDGQFYDLNSTHNDYVDLIFKGGVLGLSSYIIMILNITCKGVKHNKGLFLIVFVIIVSALFQNPLKNVKIAFYLYFVAGIVVYNLECRKCRILKNSFISKKSRMLI